MSTAWKRLGIAAFWLSWPGLYVYLRFSQRTRVVLTHKNKVLLVKGWLGSGKWILPGGGLHKGEEPSMGAAREIEEETGLRLAPEKLNYFGHVTYRNHGFRFRYYRFGAELDSKPEPVKERGEITEAEWVDISKLTARNTDIEALRTIESWRGLQGYGKI